jgi:hypothetical protein
LRPSDQVALEYALRAYSTALGRLPEDFASSLRSRLAESPDSLAHYDALQAAETAQRPYRLACAFPALPANELRILSAELPAVGLVALPNGARQLALAASETLIDEDRPV